MTDLSTAIAAEEQRLRAERDAAFQQASQRPTTKNRRAYRQAESALEEFQRAQLEDSGEAVYRNIPEMVAALDADGWKVSDSTAYEHREQGKLRMNEGGAITESQALDYARLHLRRKDGTPGHQTRNLQEEKASEEILRIREDRLMRELKRKEATGAVIPRNQVEIELSERAINLRTYQDAIARSSSGRIIKIVDGDPQKAPELIAFMLGMFRKAMDNYSRPIAGFEEEEED